MGENKGKCTALSSRQLYLLTISGTMNCLGPCSLHWVRGEAQMAGLHSWRMPKHQVTGASWILWSTFSLFSQVSCTHSILFRAASVRMCGQCWSRQPGFLDKEVLLRGRRYRASPGPRGNQLETPLCLEPRQDASCSVRGTGRSHRNSRPSGTAPRGCLLLLRGPASRSGPLRFQGRKRGLVRLQAKAILLSPQCKE